LKSAWKDACASTTPSKVLMAKVKWLGSQMIVKKTQIAKGLPW
jgi:hypothetical protein